MTLPIIVVFVDASMVETGRLMGFIKTRSRRR